jgi:2-haloacid dehalogenase
LFGDPKVVPGWFAELFLYSDAISLSGSYTPFFTLGQGVPLRAAAMMRGYGM